jgi:hypothetical protein
MKKLRFFLCVVIGLSLTLSACCSSVNPGGGTGNGDDNGGNKTNDIVGAYITESTSSGRTKYTVLSVNEDNTYALTSYYLWGQTWEAETETGAWLRTSERNLILQKYGSSDGKGYTLNLADRVSFGEINAWIEESRQLYLDRYNNDPLIGLWVRLTKTYNSIDNPNATVYNEYAVLTFNRDGSCFTAEYRLVYNADGYSVIESSPNYAWDRFNETEYDYKVGNYGGSFKMIVNSNYLTIHSVPPHYTTYVKLADSLEGYFALELAAIKATWE